MSDNTFEYEEVLDAPIDAVWAAIKRTSELDIMGGQKVIERVSDAEWTCEFDENHTTHCTATYDEAAHIATVHLQASNKHVEDTTVIEAVPEGASTRVKVSATIRGGAIVSGMLKLVGKSGVQGTNKAIVRNIASLAQGGSAHEMTADEIGGIVNERMGELKQHFKKGK